jgi:hypothetical protein
VGKAFCVELAGFSFSPSNAGRGPSGPLGFRAIRRDGRSALRSLRDRSPHITQLAVKLV